MQITDRVYGTISIPEGMLAELVESEPMQRLKKIGQTGAVAFLRPEMNITRFEHSVGVWHILEKFGASIEEQVAGLLHDTPHTAYSHVADILFPSENHDFHEQFEEEVIKNSSIPKILGKYGYKLEQILNKENFHLLEADLPDLSADRIDYFLRDTRIYPLFPGELIPQILGQLKIAGNKFVFKDTGWATFYTIMFMNAGKLLWLDPDSHGSYYLLADALKRAMELGILKMNDFFKADEDVWNILKGSSDEKIVQLLAKLNTNTRFLYCGEEEADFAGQNKPRVVDPFVETEAGLKRISEIVPRLKFMMDDYKKNNKFLSVKMVTRD